MESELASLVRRHGGEPVCVPALREVARECDAEAGQAIEALLRPRAIIVLATGVGLEGLLAAAARLGRGADLRAGMAGATVVCRGPKPIAVLKREGLTAHVRAEPPHTTAELLGALAPLPLEGRDVVFVHDGGGSRLVPLALAERGARVVEVQPYEWALPEDTRPLRDMVDRIIAGGVDAVAITTQAQAQHLFAVAESMGSAGALRKALGEGVVVAAVGPTCAHALEQLGAPPRVVPAQSKMGALVVALAAHFSRRAASA
jgi:uroporphyrinogen-III synthase